MKRLVSLCICLFLILSCFGTALAKGKTEVTECEAVDVTFDTVFYAADTMPAYVHPSYYDSHAIELNEEYCVSCEITFLSGDEGLRNAFEVYETTVYRYANGEESENQAFCITAHGINMITSGEATFLVSLESASYTYKQEKTLHVVPYESEKDLIVNPQEPIEIKLSVKEQFSYYDFAKYLTISEGAGRPDCLLFDENWNYIDYYDGEFPDQHLKFERNGDYGAIKCYFDAEGTYNYILMVNFDRIGYDVPITFIVTAYEPVAVPLSKDILQTEKEDGFSFTLPLGDGWYKVSGTGAGVTVRENNLDNGQTLQAAVIAYLLDDFVDDDDMAAQYYNMAGIDVENLESNGYRGVSVQDIQIDGHLARIARMSQETAYNYETWRWRQGARIFELLYARGMKLILLEYIIWTAKSQDQESENPYEYLYTLPEISDEDIRLLIDGISYDESKAEIKKGDITVTVTAKDSPATLSADKTLQFKAEFGNKEVVNATAKNNGIEWSVTKADGSAVPEITISEKGLLTVKKALKNTVEIVVTAKSTSFGTVGEYKLTVYPVASKVTVEPAKANLYLTEELTLTGSVEPADIPASALTWSVRPAGAVELTDNGDGTVTLKPLKAEEVTVTAKESGGKSAKAVIAVGEAVSSVEVTIKGKAKPGATLEPTVKVKPSKALDKKVVWSIDVGEDIATINSKTGELKIKKAATEGTVIHVTATAQGAPEPVSGTFTVEVGK